MAIEKGLMMFQPGDSQYMQAWIALQRAGLNRKEYSYQVSIDTPAQWIHRFKNIKTGKIVNVKV